MKQITLSDESYNTVYTLLYTHTVGAFVAKDVSDQWSDEQWALFESLGGVRKEKVSLASVTKEG